MACGERVEKMGEMLVKCNDSKTSGDLVFHMLTVVHQNVYTLEMF